MGKTLKITALFLVLFLFVALEGKSRAKDGKRPLFTPVKVNFRLVPPPRIKAGTVSSVNRGSLTLTNKRWGMVEISYFPQFGLDNKNTARRKNSIQGLWLDDVVCNVRVMACDRTRRENPVLGLFTTRVEFWTIALDWREHKYFVYLPPMLIERAMPTRGSDAKGVKLASESDFVIGVTFWHKQWGILGEEFYTPKGRMTDSDFRALLEIAPRNCTFHGSLISRSRSPWGLNDQDEIDLEKPALIPAPQDEAAVDKTAGTAVTEEAASAGSVRKKSSSANGKKNRRSK